MRWLLARLCTALADAAGLATDAVPTDMAGLLRQFPELLRQGALPRPTCVLVVMQATSRALTLEALRRGPVAATERRRIVLIIDGLDGLTERHGARDLAWLRAVRDIPTNRLRVIISVIDGQPAAQVRLQGNHAFIGVLVG